MAEENVEATEAVATETPDTPEDLGDAGKKALAAERRNAREAAKERDALASRLKEFEDRDKSDSQKLLERAEAAEKRAADTESRALRLEVAAEKGLTPAQAKRLVGVTREELEADAAELLETFRPADVTSPSLDLGQKEGAPLALNGDPLERALRQSLGIR